MNVPSSVSKSVRLPCDLVDFIESQEGSNFSEKLLGILHEYRFGDEERQRMLASYRNDITRYRDLYNQLISDYGEARRIIIHMHRYLDDMQQMAARAVEPPESKPQEPEDPDLVPGNLPIT